MEVVGIPDISRAGKASARSCPQARVLLSDMTRLDFPSSSFDVVTAFYAFTRLPQGELPPLLVRIAHWLQPGGLLVASMAPGSTLARSSRTGWARRPYFSGHDATSNRRFVERGELRLLSTGEKTIRERVGGRSTPAPFF
jgi:cyclopropane fatty-acyl-phospholipid synthase-like methyltransferase